MAKTDRLTEIATERLEKLAHRMQQEGAPFPGEVMLLAMQKILEAAGVREKDAGLLKAVPLYRLAAAIAADAASFIHAKPPTEKPEAIAPGGELRVSWDTPAWLTQYLEQQGRQPTLLMSPEPTSSHSTPGRNGGR